MSEAEQTPSSQIDEGDACEVDFAAGPIAASESAPAAGERDVLLYISPWCGDCRRAVDFLDRYEIVYRTIDITENEDAARIVESLNRGNRSTPTILINGDHVATEPSRGRLAQIFEVPDDSATYSPLRMLRRR